MSESDNEVPAATPNPRDKISPLELEEQIKRRQKVFSNLIEKLKPWLFEFGNWLFGGLLAFNLIIIAPLLTVGLVNTAVTLSIAIFACALPLNVSGLFALRLIRDMSGVPIDDVMNQAFREAGTADVEDRMPASDEAGSLHKKRTDLGLRYSMRLAALSAVLTLLGMVAALWYVGWWVALLFIAMVIVSLVMSMNMVAHLMRPDVETQWNLRLQQQQQRAAFRERQRSE